MSLEFFAWAFLNKAKYGLADEEELEEYITELEQTLGRQLEPGRGRAKSLRVTVDPVRTVYRSIFWYFVSNTKGETSSFR